MEETDVNEQGSDTQPVEATPPVEQREQLSEPTSSDFAIPEKYKTAGWTKNISSYEKLWDAHANAQELIGRKTVGIPTENSSEEEIETFYSKVRPEKEDGYDIDLGEDTALFRAVFHKNGLSARQAKAITQAYLDTVRKAEDNLYSAQGFDEVMKTNLGDNYQDRMGKVTGFLKQFGSKDALAEIDKLPNNTLGLVYKLIDLTMDKYGVKELGSVETKPQEQSAEPDLKEYMKEMEKLGKDPFATDKMRTELKRKYGIIK